MMVPITSGGAWAPLFEEIFGWADSKIQAALLEEYPSTEKEKLFTHCPDESLSGRDLMNRMGNLSDECVTPLQVAALVQAQQRGGNGQLPTSGHGIFFLVQGRENRFFFLRIRWKADQVQWKVYLVEDKEQPNYPQGLMYVRRTQPLRLV